MRYLFIFLLISVPLTIFSQVNQIDANGLRQGQWQKKYPDGTLIYKGEFKNDKPVGNWTRYYESGQVKAKIHYIESTDSAFVKFYDKRGNKISEGHYLNEQKEGKWTYFSDNRIISEENFVNGKKHGVSRKYYPSGEIFSETEWKNGKKEGKYEAFYKRGEPYMQCKYSNNMRNGLCLVRFKNGRIEMEANYLNNLRDGEWKFYNEEGDLLYTLQYDKGKLLNPEIRDSIDNLNMQQLEKNRHSIPDPEKFIQNPSEYIMKRQ